MSKFKKRSYRKWSKVKSIVMLSVAILCLLISIAEIYFGKDFIRIQYPVLHKLGLAFGVLCFVDILINVSKWSYNWLLEHKSSTHTHTVLTSTTYKRVDGELEAVGTATFDFYHDMPEDVAKEIVAWYIWDKADEDNFDESTITTDDLVAFVNDQTNFLAGRSSKEIAVFQSILFRKKRWFR